MRGISDRSHRACASAVFGILVSVSLGAAAAEPTTEDLLREIHRRDHLIDQLAQRVSTLERQMRAEQQAIARRSPRPVTATPRVAGIEPEMATPGAVANAPPSASAPSSPRSPVAALGERPPATAASPQSGVESPTAEDAYIARALENTLVNQGGLLLPPYTMQVVPDFGYTYQSTYQLSYVGLPGASQLSLATQRSHTHTLEWGLGFRLGLPWETQVSFRIPIDVATGEATFAGTRTLTSNKSGLGDVSISVQKQVLHEKGWVPDALVNVTYKAATGTSNLTQRSFSTFPYTVGTGSGFPSLGAGLTVLKRQDPLVFLGSLSYVHNFSNTIGGVRQSIGDDYGFRIGAILAASPDTSLRVDWETTFQQKGEYNGVTVPGSDQVISFVDFGVGSVITPRLFLDASVGIGLTQDSPDFRVLISLPYRF